MTNSTFPKLSEQEINEGLHLASVSSRGRHPKILHKTGASFNEVFNFITRDSYMQPHMHPGAEKIETILLVKGRLIVLYFDDGGEVVRTIELKNEGIDSIRVPAFTWHTYVVVSDEVVTYETMMGKYQPETWKRLAAWAPEENSLNSESYLYSLRKRALIHQ